MGMEHEHESPPPNAAATGTQGVDVPGAHQDRFRTIFEVSSTGTFVADAAGILLEANPAFHELLGYPPGELVGNPLDELIFPDDREAHDQLYRRVRVAGKQVLELRYLRRGGQPVWTRLTLALMPGDDTIVYVGMVDNMAERRRWEQQLRYQAHHDDTTGLPNRSLLLERLQRLMHHQRHEQHFALLLVGLDRLKEINNTFGHRYGDRLLQQLGTRLRGAMQSADTVARLDGDELALLLPGVAVDEVVARTEQVIALARAPFDLGEQSLDIDVNVGVVLFPDHGYDTKTIMRRADIALHAAKRDNTSYALYEPEQGIQSQRQMALAGDLRRAIESDQLVVHYQPKIDFATGKVDGVEALVRWHHPTYGLVLPTEFIPLAEHTGLIKPLTSWVLTESLRQCRKWQQSGIELRMVVNFSARMLHDHKLIAMVTEALEVAGMTSASLGLEITESAVMIDPQRARLILTQLNAMGVDISIDDFGTGYSSFAYLDQLPACEIKIDRSFVQDMVRNASHFRIVHGTIDIGHDLGLKTVAEGVEDKATLDALKSLGCDVAQGYYVSRPMPGDDLARWLMQRAEAR